MIYLAAPYSHGLEAVRQQRAAKINEYAARLIENGEVVFSPISYGHAIVPYFSDQENATGFNVWRQVDLLVLSICTEMLVLMLNGWAQSKGIREETAFAKDLKIPVEYIEV